MIYNFKTDFQTQQEQCTYELTLTLVASTESIQTKSKHWEEKWTWDLTPDKENVCT